MNIEDIKPGMQVRVKTFDELESEGYITHIGGIPDFKRLFTFGCLKYRMPHFGRICHVENVSGSNVYLRSCYYDDNNVFRTLQSIWWDARLLSRVENPIETEDNLDETELSLFLDEFVQK